MFAMGLDGDKDCQNGRDEENCPTTTELPHKTDVAAPTCHDWMFHCGNDRCVPYWWKCDGFNDCSNGSDEAGCPNNTVSTTIPTPTIQIEGCLPTQFMCDTGRCLAKSYVCDGFPDCTNGEDETDCPHERCGRDKFR